eukprot:scaffold225122_cov18-Tisochrysis_lutea.AAC.1
MKVEEEPQKLQRPSAGSEAKKGVCQFHRTHVRRWRRRCRNRSAPQQADACMKVEEEEEQKSQCPSAGSGVK